MKVKFKVKNIDDAIIDKVQTVLVDPDFLTEANTIYADMIEPWVPYITGRLAHSGRSHIDAEGVHYTVDYAQRVYESQFPHNVRFHPLASSYWDEVAMQSKGEDLIAAVRELLIDKLRK